MSYGLSFTEDFFWGEGAPFPEEGQPTCVMQALERMTREDLIEATAYSSAQLLENHLGQLSQDFDWTECSTQEMQEFAEQISHVSKQMRNLTQRRKSADLMDHDTLVCLAFDIIRDVNTCTDLRTPVDVWISPDGSYSVEIY